MAESWEGVKDAVDRITSNEKFQELRQEAMIAARKAIMEKGMEKGAEKLFSIWKTS